MASAGAIRAGSAFVELTLKDGLASGLDKAAAKLRAFGAGMKEVGTSFIAAGAAVVAPILASVKSYADIGSRMKDMSDETGVSVEALSELGYAATQSGTDLESLQAALVKMQRNIGEAALGSKTAQAALAQLGLSAKDLAALSPDQQFKVLAERLSRIQDPAKRAAATLDLFGRGGAKLLPLMKDGAKGIELLQKQARDLGLTLSTKDAQAAEAFGDTLDTLWLSVKMVAFQVGAALMPMLKDLANQVIALGGRARAWVKENAGLIVSALKLGVVLVAAGAALVVVGTAVSGVSTALAALAAVFGAVGWAVGSLGGLIGAMLTPVGLVVTAIAALGAVLLYVTGTGEKALAWLGERFDALKADALAAFQGISDALMAGDITLAAKILWLTLKMEFGKGVQWLAGIWADVALAAGDAWDSIYSSAATAWNWWVEAAKNALDTVYSLVLKAANAIAAAFWTAIQGIVDAFLSIGDKVATAGYALHLIDDKELTQLDQALQNMRATSTAFTEGKKEQASSLYGDEAAASKERQQANTSAYTAEQKAIDQERQQAATDRMAGYVSDLKASEDALAQAKDEWQAAIQEAAQKRQAAGTEETGPGQAPATDAERYARLLAEAGDFAMQSAAKIEVAGTFNAAAAAGLGAGSAGERTAKATEETARNTKRLLDEAKLGGAAFA